MPFSVFKFSDDILEQIAEYLSINCSSIKNIKLG